MGVMVSRAKCISPGVINSPTYKPLHIVHKSQDPRLPVASIIGLKPARKAEKMQQLCGKNSFGRQPLRKRMSGCVKWWISIKHGVHWRCKPIFLDFQLTFCMLPICHFPIGTSRHGSARLCVLTFQLLQVATAYCPP